MQFGNIARGRLDMSTWGWWNVAYDDGAFDDEENDEIWWDFPMDIRNGLREQCGSLINAREMLRRQRREDVEGAERRESITVAARERGERQCTHTLCGRVCRHGWTPEIGILKDEKLAREEQYTEQREAWWDILAEVEALKKRSKAL